MNAQDQHLLGSVLCRQFGIKNEWVQFTINKSLELGENKVVACDFYHFQEKNGCRCSHTKNTANFHTIQ